LNYYLTEFDFQRWSNKQVGNEELLPQPEQTISGVPKRIQAQFPVEHFPNTGYLFSLQQIGKFIEFDFHYQSSFSVMGSNPARLQMQRLRSNRS
jgi:hypothetical protein